MHGANGEEPPILSQNPSARFDVTGLDLVRDIDEPCGGSDIQDHPLHGRDKAIARAEIR